MKKSVLIVDDDVIFRATMAAVLERAGYQALLAKDGNEGYEKFRNDLPDMMIVDLVMPRLNGAELMKKVRGTQSGQRLPVLMMTGVFPSPTLERDARGKWGVNELLMKGANVETVLRKVEQLIGPGEAVKRA